MDPKRAMKLHEEQFAAADPEERQEEQPESPAKKEESPRGPLSELRKALLRGKPSWVVTVAIAAFIILIVVLALQERTPEIATEEIPFQSMVEETEERVGASLEDHGAVQPAAPPPPADSLTLTVVITDSVWFHLLIDDQEPLEFIFPPERRRTWKARERFLVTMGNAGGVEFNLNDKTIGVLGETGQVMRNVEFSRQTLETE